LWLVAAADPAFKCLFHMFHGEALVIGFLSSVRE
jgi:hypothetical protein